MTRRIHLVRQHGQSRGTARYHPGQPIPQDGIYRVTHADRRSHEVTLLGVETFPHCEKCGSRLTFQYLRPPQAAGGDFRIRLYAIPHPGEDERQQTAAAR